MCFGHDEVLDKRRYILEISENSLFEMAKLSLSGEWLVANNDVPPSGPVELKLNTKLRSASFFDAHICYECGHAFRTCECKSCLKCGTPFVKYFGTRLIKGRSHCRVCASPVCVTCIVVIKGLEKVCTRCHLKQKEEEISTEKALSAICEAKFGLGDSYANLSKLKTISQKTDALFVAAKRGLDHVMLTLFNFGCKVDSTDSKQNTPLFYAAEGGYLQCIVLLLEKGADIKSRNNIGWTPLHALAWKGTTGNHVECVEYLIEMGVNVLAESSSNETAADVAERCHATTDVIQILRAAELEVAIGELNKRVTVIMGNSNVTPKEQQVCRMISSLLRFVKSTNAQIEIEDTEKKTNEEVTKTLETVTQSSSVDYQTSPRTLCHKCRGSTLLGVSTSPVIDERPIADVEPIVRTPSPKPPIALGGLDSTKTSELQMKLENEKKVWEDRCRKLMASIGASTKEHKKDIKELESRIKTTKEEHATTLTKCEATYTNKVSKMRQETELQLQTMAKEMRDLETAQTEVLKLQKNFKLTWIPDHLVNECQHPKCRAQFSTTIRKHHCRCCGRVFCGKCTQQKTRLDALQYTKPVRVCTTCYALIDDIFKSESASKNELAN